MWKHTLGITVVNIRMIELEIYQEFGGIKREYAEENDQDD
jgi:hypothetical protein